jgi:RNA polymerase sigma-B factor
MDARQETERLPPRHAGAPGDAALELIVLRHRPLARRLARRFARAGRPLDDLEQVACEGLIKAARRFDRARGCAFTSFAVPTILGELRRFCRDTGWVVHVPRGVQERVLEVRRAARDLAAERGGRQPTVGDLATRVGCDEDEVVEALWVAHSSGSVPLKDDGADTDLREPRGPRAWLAYDDPGYEHVECLTALESALPALTRVQREVMRLHFAEELSRHEIAARLGLSPTRAGRLLYGALDALRVALGEDAPEPSGRARDARLSAAA